ncbi:LysE family translocator [Sphingomonas sp.]|uniref:LysE family translocator n=1 Tax=Sphingomonas sp. TaxID=28214 RepID=UPI003D6CD65E
MTVVQSLIAFVAAATLLSITPGIDTAMVLRTATGGGARRGLLAAAGIGLGCLVWGSAVAVGLGALLAASEIAFTALKWAGAAYLMWMGIRLILNPRRSIDLDAAGGVQKADRPLQVFARGFLTNILNPKVGVFYITFLPQFVPPGTNVALFSFLLTLIHVVIGTAWLGILIAATVPLTRTLSRPAVVKSIDRLTGGVFIAFGIKLALARR